MVRPARILRAAMVLATTLSACTASREPPSTSPARDASSSAEASVPSGDPRIEGWMDDLEQLLPAMDAIHPALYHSTSKTRLHREVERLVETVPNANDDELMVGVLRLVARVSADGRDGHTGVFVWGTGDYLVHSLPLRLWSFADGLFVVDALGRYRALIGDRVVSIAGRPIRAALDAVHPLVPRDNPSTVELITPRFLLVPEILHGVGLVRSTGPVAVGDRSRVRSVEDHQGRSGGDGAL